MNLWTTLLRIFIWLFVLWFQKSNNENTFICSPSWLFPVISLSCYQYQVQPPEPHLLASEQPEKHNHCLITHHYQVCVRCYAPHLYIMINSTAHLFNDTVNNQRILQDVLTDARVEHDPWNKQWNTILSLCADFSWFHREMVNCWGLVHIICPIHVMRAWRATRLLHVNVQCHQTDKTLCLMP